jgi:hypothetical protein
MGFSNSVFQFKLKLLKEVNLVGDKTGVVIVIIKKVNNRGEC